MTFLLAILVAAAATLALRWRNERDVYRQIAANMERSREYWRELYQAETQIKLRPRNRIFP